MADPWDFLAPQASPAPPPDPWGFLAPSSSGDGWEPTGSPLIQKRRRDDGSYETRPTPQAGREPAVGAVPQPDTGVWPAIKAAGSLAGSELQAGLAGAADIPRKIADYLATPARLVASIPRNPHYTPVGLDEQGEPQALPVWPSREAMDTHVAYPQSIEDIRQAIAVKPEEGRQRLAEASSTLPAPVAVAAHQNAMILAGVADPLNWLLPGGGEEKAAAEGVARAGEEAALRDVARPIAKYTPEELDLLAAREAGMRRLPPADLPAEVPHVGPVGRQTSEAAQLQALGMRAAPEDAAALARETLPIGEPGWTPPAAPDPWGFLGAPAENRPVLSSLAPEGERAKPGGFMRPDDAPLPPRGLPAGDAALESAGHNMTPEFKPSAVRPAVLLEGKIFTGETHADAVEAGAQRLGLSFDQALEQEAAKGGDLGHRLGGYVTADGRFIGEEEARTLGAEPGPRLWHFEDSAGGYNRIAGDAVEPLPPLRPAAALPRSPAEPASPPRLPEIGPQIEPGAVLPASELPRNLDVQVARILDSKTSSIPEVQNAAMPPGLTTGTTHAITRGERIAAGLPEVERLAARESPSWDEAKAIYERDPAAARDLAQEVAKKPRQLTDVENDVLLHDRMHLTLDYKDALAAEDAARQSGDATAAALATSRRQAIEVAKTTSDEALDKAGTIWGRAGAARQKLVAEDYSALHLTQRYAAATRGEGVPDVVRTKLADISTQLEAAQARAVAAEERAQELEAARVVAYQAKQAGVAARGGRRAMSRAQLDIENDTLTKAFAARAATPRAGLDPELAAIMARKAKNRIQAGVTNLQDLVDGLYNDAKPYLSDLEPRDVRDVIAGSGPRAQQVARATAETDLARLRREARVLNALDDVQARLAGEGLDPATRHTLEAELARWQSEAAKLGPGRGPLSDLERLAGSKKRAAAAVADLERQLAAGEFPSRARAPIAPDAELLSARADVQRLRRQADRIVASREAANRGPLDKAMDWTAGWGRFVKLTGVATLQKLSAAAGERALLFRPLEEFLGGGLSRLPVVKHFAAEAPIEGGASTAALAKSFGGFFGRQAREEAGALLRGGEGPLDLALGKPHGNPGVPAWMEYPGKLHGALKAPAKVAGYQYAMEKQAQHYLARGEGEQLLNPLVQAEMRARAWESAQRDIFMGDNAFVNAFNQALRDVPRQTKVTKAVKTGARVLLPIVKVPTNYALEVGQHVAGLPIAAARMGNVMWQGRAAAEAGSGVAGLVRAGLQEVGPAEAELIMRELKKGSIGAGLIALGAAGAVKGGGYYEPGAHRRPTDLQPGEISIAGHHVPHMILHHPAIEALQIGAEIHRQRQLADGLKNAARGVAEGVPFYGELAQTQRDDATRFLGGVERGISIPPDIQRLARVLDQHGSPGAGEKFLQELGWVHIDANKRKPRGGIGERLWEEEELGIPGLRQGVR